MRFLFFLTQTGFKPVWKPVPNFGNFKPVPNRFTNRFLRILRWNLRRSNLWVSAKTLVFYGKAWFLLDQKFYVGPCEGMFCPPLPALLGLEPGPWGSSEVPRRDKANSKGMYRRILRGSSHKLLGPGLGDPNWLSYPIGVWSLDLRKKKNLKSLGQKSSLWGVQKTLWISVNFQYFFMRFSLSITKFPENEVPIFFKTNQF